MIANLLYDIANYYVVPFWLLIVFLPNWKTTQQVMKSLLLFLPLALLFLYFLSQAVTLGSASNLLFAPLEEVMKFFTGKEAVALAWVQFLTLDLFVGRWIYWEGQRTGVFTTHSILLSHFGGGPSGILSHMITVWVSQNFLPKPTPIPQPETPALEFPKAIFSVSQQEFDPPLGLTVFDVEKGEKGTLPEDLQGHVFIVGPGGTIDAPRLQNDPPVVEPSKNGWIPLFNGDGIIYRLDFHQTPKSDSVVEPGQVCPYDEEVGQAWLASRIVKTPCYYADAALATNPKYRERWPNEYRWMKFRNFGLARLSLKLGSRNSLNTAFLPMQFPGQKERLLVTWDAGRPYEINPCSLEVTAPVGWNWEWSPISPVNKFGTFAQVLSAAHPQFDPKTGEMFTVNGVKSMFTLAGLSRLLKYNTKRFSNYVFKNIIFKYILGFFIKIISFIFFVIEFFLRQLKIGGEDIVYLQKWKGKGILKRWKVVTIDNRPLKINQSLHQMGLTQNYIILADSAFKISLVHLLPNLKSEISNFIQGKEKIVEKFERFMRSILSYPQLSYTDIYIISREALELHPHKIKAKRVRIEPEVSHYLADYDDKKGQKITLHLAHTSASDPTEFIHEQDFSVYCDPELILDPSQRKKNKSNLTSMHGMVCDSMDVSRLSCCIIDVDKIGKTRKPYIQTFVSKEQSIAHLWSAAIYAYRDNQPTEWFSDIYWTCWGVWKDLFSQYILEMYKDYSHRMVSIEDIRDKIINPGKPSNLCRLHIDRSGAVPVLSIKENYNFGDVMLGNSPQFVPKAGSTDPTEGYIVCVVIHSHNKLANNSEIWIFDAQNIERGPRYKLTHPNLNFGMTIHTTWLRELAHPPVSDYDVELDYRDLVKKMNSEAVTTLFQEDVYPHFSKAQSHSENRSG
jgi:carotenoid cleavage dioxygenase-like enzyme